METENLAERLHGCLIIIADEIKRICEKNNIPFFLIGGTLLGAIRHGGIIPWDDDVDIGMLRSDYNKFESVCKKELSDRFTFVSINEEKHYAFPYIKIFLNGTHFPEENTPKDVTDGIFVDVFPIDRMPSGKFAQKYQKNVMQLFKGALYSKCGYNLCKISGKGARFVYKLFSVLPKKFLAGRVSSVQARWNNDPKSPKYLNLCGTYVYGREAFPRESLENEFPHTNFENRSYPIPFAPEKPLTMLYGDFMKLPPEEKRIFRHLSSEIDFGKY